MFKFGVLSLLTVIALDTASCQASFRSREDAAAGKTTAAKSANSKLFIKLKAEIESLNPGDSPKRKEIKDRILLEQAHLDLDMFQGMPKSKLKKHEIDALLKLI